MGKERMEIDCGEVFSIAQSMEVYAQLSVAYEEQQAVSIDVSKITRIDTSALQLLYSFQQVAGERNLAVSWTEASPVFKESVAILGMPEFYSTT